jgi:hypothetical protein
VWSKVGHQGRPLVAKIPGLGSYLTQASEISQHNAAKSKSLRRMAANCGGTTLFHYSQQFPIRCYLIERTILKQEWNSPDENVKKLKASNRCVSARELQRQRL